MSLELTPFATASGMARAMSASNTGLSLEAVYVGVGTGLQTIELDQAGRAITDTMKAPKAFLPILNAVKISPYQHCFYVDISDVSENDWNFSELVLADENQDAIAIYGNNSQALMTVSKYIDAGILAINLLHATLPADSINIVHQGIPLELLTIKDKLVAHNSIVHLAVLRMQKHVRDAQEKRERAIEDGIKQQQIEQQNQAISGLTQQLANLQTFVTGLSERHEKSVVVSHNANVTLATTQMNQTLRIGVLN